MLLQNANTKVAQAKIERAEVLKSLFISFFSRRTMVAAQA